MSSKAKSISWDSPFKSEMDVFIVLLIRKMIFFHQKKKNFLNFCHRIFLTSLGIKYALLPQKTNDFYKKCEYENFDASLAVHNPCHEGENQTAGSCVQ